MTSANKDCFVICPLGDEGSQTRRQSDCLLQYIIRPALQGQGYNEPMRVDKSDLPSHITSEIILRLVKCDLVIADLSKLNPNVFYELGIRHAYKKPTILVSDWEEKPPFDISGINIIKYIYDDPNSHLQTAERIRQQIITYSQGAKVSNPVTVSLGFERLSETGDESDKLIIALSEEIRSLRESHTQLTNYVNGSQNIYRNSNALRPSQVSTLSDAEMERRLTALREAKSRDERDAQERSKKDKS